MCLASEPRLGCHVDSEEEHCQPERRRAREYMTADLHAADSVPDEPYKRHPSQEQSRGCQAAERGHRRQ